MRRLRAGAARLLSTSKERVSRSRRERRDSVTEAIVEERLLWRSRLEASGPGTAAEAAVDAGRVGEYRRLGLGVKRAGRGGVFRRSTGRLAAVRVAAQGGARPPALKHALPEVALAGHANAGKSTLLNALAGLEPSRGAAGVSDRAGWTTTIDFYRVGAKPPRCYLVDLPGYGHSVAPPRDQRAWARAGLDYLRTRPTLAAAVFVVDATRGLCDLDRDWLAALAARREDGDDTHAPPSLVALSKADLLAPDLLAVAARLVEADAGAAVFPTCGTTGAGVDALWAALAARADACSERPHGPRGVPIHASALRQRVTS